MFFYRSSMGASRAHLVTIACAFYSKASVYGIALSNSLPINYAVSYSRNRRPIIAT